jgi:hypothetical protein
VTALIFARPASHPLIPPPATCRLFMLLRPRWLAYLWNWRLPRDMEAVLAQSFASHQRPGLEPTQPNRRRSNGKGSDRTPNINVQGIHECDPAPGLRKGPDGLPGIALTGDSRTLPVLAASVLRYVLRPAYGPFWPFPDERRLGVKARKVRPDKRGCCSSKKQCRPIPRSALGYRRSRLKVPN